MDSSQNHFSGNTDQPLCSMLSGLALTRVVLSSVCRLHSPGLFEHILEVTRCRHLLRDNHLEMTILCPSEKSSIDSERQLL